MTALMEIIQDKIVELIFGATGLIVWWLDRSKLKAEIEGLRLENETKKTDKDVKVIDLYQEALDDLKKRFDERIDEMKARYEEKFEILQQQNEKKLETLETEIKSLRTNLELWKTKYRSLKEEFESKNNDHKSTT